MNHDTHHHESTRPVPAAIDAEQAVLGAMMLSDKALADGMEHLDESDFYRRDHRIIFRAICNLRHDGQPADAVTVSAYVEQNHADDLSSAYVIDLANNTTTANVTAYIELVRERATSRRLIEAGTAIVESAFTDTATTAYATALSQVTAIQPRVSLTELPPVDLFDDSLVVDLRPEWCPPHLSEFVFASSRVKGSPPEVLFLSSLIACSMACHDDFRVQPRPNEPGWTEPARLWGMIVGDPSARKSPPMKLALAPLNEMNFRMADRYLGQKRHYEETLKTFHEQEKTRRKAQAKGDVYIAPDETPDNAPEQPRQERIIVHDATIEKLSDMLADNPRGLLYTNDELAGWFASMDMYSKSGSSGRDRSCWLKFYDGGSLIIDRMSRDTTIVDNASMRVLGAIQPDRIRSLASRMDDDGLLQRFIIAVIPPQSRRPSDEPEPADLIKKYNGIVTQLWNTVPGGRQVVRMSPEAMDWQNKLSELTDSLIGNDGLPSMLRSGLAKWAGLFPRLCLTYHMIGCAAGKVYPTSVMLQGTTAERVYNLMRHWILPNAMTFYSGLLGNASPAMSLAKQAANAILGRAMTRVSNRDLTQFVSAWRSSPDWLQRQAIQCLEQSGWLMPARVEDGKRAASWPVNPRVHVEFAAKAARVAYYREQASNLLVELKQAKNARNAAAPD